MHCLWNYRNTRTLSGVTSKAWRAQDTVKSNYRKPWLCVCKNIHLLFFVPKIGIQNNSWQDVFPPGFLWTRTTAWCVFGPWSQSAPVRSWPFSTRVRCWETQPETGSSWSIGSFSATVPDAKTQLKWERFCQPSGKGQGVNWPLLSLLMRNWLSGLFEQVHRMFQVWKSQFPVTRPDIGPGICLDLPRVPRRSPWQDHRNISPWTWRQINKAGIFCKYWYLI